MNNVLIDDRRIHVDFSQSVAKVRWRGKGKGFHYVTETPEKNNENYKQHSSRHKGREKYNSNQDNDRSLISNRYKEHQNRREYKQEKERKSDHKSIQTHKSYYSHSRSSEKKDRKNYRKSRSRSRDRENYYKTSHKDKYHKKDKTRRR